MFIIVLKELDINGGLCEILLKFLEFTNKHRKKIENGYDSQFEDYGDINQEEKLKHMNDKLGKLTIQGK